MTKQEQVEEMSNDLNLIKSLQSNGIYSLDYQNYQEATALFALGYRKVYDHSVVMTKDELKQCKAQATKEFAEKLKIKAIRLSEIENYHVCNLIDELLKEYEE